MVSVSGARLVVHARSARDPFCQLVLLHGWGDHAQRYTELMERLAGSGISCLAPDFEGHGESSGPRAQVHDLEPLLRDLGRLLEKHSGPPCFLYGHSMGGAVAAHFALRHPERIAGVVFDSGALGINARVPRWKRVVARALGGVAPRLRVGTLKEARHMSASAEIQARYLADPLTWHGPIDAGTGRTLLLANAFIERERHRFAVPFLALQGMDDELVDVSGPRRLKRECTAPGEVIEFEGLRHDLLSELGPERLGACVERWLRERCARADSSEPRAAR